VNPPYTQKLGGNPMKLSTEQQWRAWLIQQARRIVHCQDDAEDVVQDTLLAYWKRFGSLPWDECADDTQLQRKCAWCCQKLRALALDSCRRAHRRYEMLILNDDVLAGGGTAGSSGHTGYLASASSTTRISYKFTYVPTACGRAV
jgi:DNA-directed RNA polymerase specialized sigma24 family protein